MKPPFPLRASGVPAILAVFACALVSGPMHALTAQTSDVTLLLKRSYTTTASVFPNPRAVSAFDRNEHTVLEDLTGFAAAVQVPIPETEFLVGLTVEYLSYVDEGDKPIALGGVVRTLPVRDGFAIIPVELSGMISIPIQSETIRLTMAGGGGLYFANRILEVAGVGVSPTSTTVGYGIHVAFGVEYRVYRGVWIHGETRFRDPDMTVEYTYDKSSTPFNGATIPFPASPMQTRINVDGMSLSIGIMVGIPHVFGE